MANYQLFGNPTDLSVLELYSFTIYETVIDVRKKSRLSIDKLQNLPILGGWLQHLTHADEKWNNVNILSLK